MNFKFDKDKFNFYTEFNMAKRFSSKEFIPVTPIPKKVINRFLEALEDLLESIEYSSPEFWKEIEESRKSGRVSGKKVKKELGL